MLGAYVGRERALTGEERERLPARDERREPALNELARERVIETCANAPLVVVRDARKHAHEREARDERRVSERAPEGEPGAHRIADEMDAARIFPREQRGEAVDLALERRG